MNSPAAHQLIWITPKWPFPVEDGARQATYHLVRSLALELGVAIHLCAIVPPDEDGSVVDPLEAQKVLGVAKVTLIRRGATQHLRNLLRNSLTHPSMPLTVAPYASAEVARQMEEVLKADAAPVLVFDGLHAAGWLNRVGQPPWISQRRLVYRAHNVEANLWWLGAKSRRGLLLPAFLNFQGSLIARMEKDLCRRSEYVAAVSEDDVQGLKRAYGKDVRAERIAIGMEFKEGSQNAGDVEAADEKSLFFIGRLDWKPNREGLDWFLRQVWPEVLKQDPLIRLRVAGAGDGSWLEAHRDLPRLEILGRVPDVAPYYRTSMAALVPVFYGSGTRVKAIEASSYSRACISTQLGVEGIGLDEKASYFRAETKEQWIETILGMSKEEASRRGLAAFKTVRSEFDPVTIARKFLSAIPL